MPYPVYDGGPSDPFANIKAMLNELPGVAEGTAAIAAGRHLSTALKSVCLAVSVLITALKSVYLMASVLTIALKSVDVSKHTLRKATHKPNFAILKDEYYPRPRPHSPPPSSSARDNYYTYPHPRARSPPPPPPQGTKPRNDLYDVLGISRSATAAEIKKAHRAMSLKWHPDRCGEGMKDRFTEIMAEINQANDVLGDEGKWAYYDKTGLMASDS
ncbi:hypothetical protein CFE70_003574 [Pyrenophora teres f. teres 0-1]